MNHRQGLHASIAVGLAGLVLRVGLGATMRSPFLFYDEITGPAVARWATGDASEFFGVSGTPLYGLLLTPLAAWTDPDLLFRGSLLLNAVIYSALPPILYLIGREVFGAAPTRAVVGAGVGSLTAASFAFSVMLVPEALLTFASTALILVAHRSERTQRWWPVTAMVGVVALAHPRGMVMGVAVMATTGIATAWGTMNRTTAVRLIFGCAAALAVAAFVTGLIADQIYVSSPGSDPSDVLLGGFDRPLLVGRSALGTAWYLVAATAGVSVIGAGGVLVRSRRPNAPFAVSLIGIGFVGATLLSALLVSGLMERDGRRVDAFAYGRYVEYLLPLLLVGAIATWDDSARLRAGLAGVAVTIVAVGSVAAELLYQPQFWFGPNAQSNVSGLHWMARLQTPLDLSQLWVFAGAAGVVTLVAALRNRPEVAAGVAAVVAVVAGIAFSLDWARIVSSDARDRAQMASILEEEDVRTIVVPLDSIDPIQLQLVTFWAPDVHVELIETWLETDGTEGTFVLTDLDALGRIDRLSRVADDPTGDLSLWQVGS